MLLLCTACSNSKTVKVMGPNNEVISERDQVTGWGSTADTTKTFTGREFDRCMYYMQQGSQGRAGLDARSAYQYCSTNGTSMSGMVGGYYGAGARGYIPGGGRGNVMVVPDYASGMPTTPTDVGIDPASIVTREQYDADQKRIGQAIAEERDQRLRSVKKRPK
ncbi:hypothetical protein IT408_03580 [Candidatus Uhrbacteria bacterium]|nr:hypothetical protein [Candidatus Uhrbacteria bacterium]